MNNKVLETFSISINVSEKWLIRRTDSKHCYIVRSGQQRDHQWLDPTSPFSEVHKRSLIITFAYIRGSMLCLTKRMENKLQFIKFEHIVAQNPLEVRPTRKLKAVIEKLQKMLRHQNCLGFTRSFFHCRAKFHLIRHGEWTLGSCEMLERKLTFRNVSNYHCQKLSKYDKIWKNFCSEIFLKIQTFKWMFQLILKIWKRVQLFYQIYLT